MSDITEAMTTNETLFFRDQKPFDLFRDVLLPKLMEGRQDSKRIRIWCAACSGGQEPYSLAMILKELGAKLMGGVLRSWRRISLSKCWIRLNRASTHNLKCSVAFRSRSW